MMAIILILRVVLGVFWLWAGLSKWIYGFDATAFLQETLANHAVLSTPYSGLVKPLIEWSAKTGISVVNAAIPTLEFATGAWLLYGKNSRGAVLVQTAMSLLFVTCGAISWNPLLLASSTLILALPIPKAASDKNILAIQHGRTGELAGDQQAG